MQNYNVFAGAFVDRIGERRKDADWIATAMHAPGTYFVPVWGDRCLVGGESLSLKLPSREQVSGFVDDSTLIFLGLFRDHPAFALPLNRDHDMPFAELGEFRDLRFLGSVLPPDEANLAAHARALVIWHLNQSFCGVCGAVSEPQVGGNSRRCSNSLCAREVFPRVDPAIIVLIHDGDRCLLGRQGRWPPGRYSTIAGFVEPGESLEDAVRREVWEETNVEVADIRYHSSQPWPFPSSLMLGFMARATTTAIALNDKELEDARWFSRKEIQAGNPELPFRISIARRLIDEWVERTEA